MARTTQAGTKGADARAQATAQPAQPTRSGPSADELREMASRVVANRDYQADVTAPSEVDHKRAVDLKVSQRDQRENGVVGRRAHAVGEQLYIEETVLDNHGDTATKWKLATKPLRS